MGKIITFLFLIPAMGDFVGAQSYFPELENKREIRLLESTRPDVRAIMSEFDRSGYDSDDEESDRSVYKYDVAGGKIDGSGANVARDFTRSRRERTTAAESAARRKTERLK